MNRHLVRWSLALLLVSSFASRAAQAEPCGEQAENEESKGGNFVVKEVDGQKVYVIKDAITVCGKVPRPSVVYVLQPRTINYQWENLKQDFLPKILDSVKKAPF